MATYILGQKLRSPNQTWLDVIQNIKLLVPKPELDNLIERTVRNIKKKIKSGAGFGLAWSGGKDSQVLRFVLTETGYQLPAVLGLCDLEYPAFLTWVEKNKPRN